MANGRNGRHREKEFTDRGLDLDVSRRKDFHYSKGEHARYRNGDFKRQLIRGRDRDVRGKIRVGQKDFKEREVLDGGYHNSPSTSNSGSGGTGRRQGGLSDRILDREPGELSSGSGYDDDIAPETQFKDKEFSKVKDETESSANKRKFSPIVWDRQEKQASTQSKIKTIPVESHLPPHTPLPNSVCQSPNRTYDTGMHVSSVKPNLFQDFKPSPVKHLVAPRSFGSSFPDVQSDLPSSSPLEQCLSNEQEPGQLEEEDSFPAWNISASRWAVENHYPADEGISDDEDISERRRRIPSFELLDIILNTKRLSPKLGELNTDGSEGARSKSMESNDGFHAEPASADEHHEHELERNDYMEIDMDHQTKDVNDKKLDMDQENGDNSCKTPESVVPRSINMFQGCRSVFEFEKLNRINEGTYGVVYRARDMKTGEIVALKKVKMEKEREGFPLTSLREINILLSFHHPSVVDVKEVVMGDDDDSIFMAMEYMEHDLKCLMETMKQPFSQNEVKCLMIQLLEGVKYLHDNWVLHRDLKTSNLLLNNRGELKICDFGLSRQYGSQLKPYTHLVVTLWYRAPELLLGAREYSTAIDMWSLGCIMAELLAKEPLFSANSEIDLLEKIFRTLGTPNETIWPGFSKFPKVKINFVKHQYNLLRKKFPAMSFTGSHVLSDAGFDLLNKLLTYDPEKRITAEAALNHGWFHEVPLPKSKDFMPTFPAQHAQDRYLM